MINAAVREQEPVSLDAAVEERAAELQGVSRPKLQQRLHGDLSTIVAKCIRPHPKDRYNSVNELMDDVRRHLEGRPVLAQPQTLTYRVSKFVRRNRVSVVSVAAALILVAGTTGYALWRQEQAFREAQRALQMQTFMYRLFKLANSNYTGKPDATLPEFLRLGVGVLPQYIPEHTDQIACPRRRPRMH